MKAKSISIKNKAEYKEQNRWGVFVFSFETKHIKKYHSSSVTTLESLILNIDERNTETRAQNDQLQLLIFA